MEDADLILTGGIVVTMNDAGDVYDGGAVAVRGDQIVAVGPAHEVAAAVKASEVVNCTGQAVIPGLINAHTHLAMTLLRGLADDRRLDVWLLGYMMPVEREFVNPDFVRLGTLLACAEMIRSGITCFADMYYYEEDVAWAVVEAGLRGLCAQTVLKFPTPDAISYEDSLAASRDFISRWKGHPLVVPGVAPHAPYTCTEEILRACAELAVEFDVPLHIHIAETALEVEDSRREHGMPVVPWVKKQGVLEAKVLAAHCVHIDTGEMRTLRNARAGVAHNPTSNLKLSSGIAPVKQMLEAGLHVGIGTDGPASNNDLDMFEEMRLAALLAKGATGDPTVLPAKQALALATIDGARALHMGDITGSLEVGKRADVAVVDLVALHQTPKFAHDAHAVYGQLVYSGKSADVVHVLCNGRWLMRDRSLLTLSEADLALQAQEVAEQIDAFLVTRESDVLRKLVSIGGVSREESFEVQVKAQIAEPERVVQALDAPDVAIIKHSLYRQYDTYLIFPDAEGNRLRYREDEIQDEGGKTVNARYRLTLTGPAKEREFAHSVLLSRSRYIAPADRTLRFYREYFQPVAEREVHKERRRWRIRFRGTEFAINLDKLDKPEMPGYFLEIKSRTWSMRDAERKAELIGALLERFGVTEERLFAPEYVDLVAT
jgi:5-methylthioadenosine/S-adenosylhomocysteine deaminase